MSASICYEAILCRFIWKSEILETQMSTNRGMVKPHIIPFSYKKATCFYAYTDMGGY